jgi:hypothetical protein
MYDDNALPGRGDIGRAGDSVAALHAHLPVRPFQVLHLGLAHILQTLSLDESGDAQEAGANVRRLGV